MRTHVSSSQFPRSPPTPTAVHAELTFLDHRAFLAEATVGADACRFVWPDITHLVDGTPVTLRVGFAGESVAFIVSGTVIGGGVARAVERGGTVVEVRGPALAAFSRMHAHARGRPVALGRRESRRHEVSLRAELTNDVGPQTCRVLDVSRGGAFVAIDSWRAMERGASVKLRFRLGWLSWVQADARVISMRRAGGVSGAGLQFLTLSPRDQKRLTRYLERHELR